MPLALEGCPGRVGVQWREGGWRGRFGLGVSRLVVKCIGRLVALGIARGAKGVWRGLVVFGEALVGPIPGGGEPGAGPLPGHPERLRSDVPLSEWEREIGRELARCCDWLPTRNVW
ncbi:DUF6059 family protein [Streptomyces sp. V4I23]|uniref:DUF6059 family protein n=1 Tax=Streptomyces sp. V4I23 TaxID=3042282 RepID=UPI00358DFA31